MHFGNELRWLVRSFFLGLFLCLPSLPAQAMTDAEINKLFNEALEESESGELSNAIAIFETILSDRPNMNRVRLELALANFRSLNYAAAKQLAEKVLADPTTPESVKQNIRVFLNGIDARGRPHTWSAFASLGYIYDDNINVGPGTDTIDIGGQTLVLDAGSTPISADGIQVNAGIGHRYLVPNTYNIFGDQAALAWQSQLSLFRNQYIGESDFNLNVISASTGPALLVSRKWRAQLNATLDHISLGNDSLAWFTGLSPTLSWFFGTGTSLTATFQVQDRNFTSSANKDRDALFLSTGLSLGHQFKSELKPSVTVSARVFTTNAETERRSNEGVTFNAGFNIQPVKNSNLYVSYNWLKRNYDGPEPVFGIVRDEIERRYSIGGNYRLKTGNLLNDLVINMSYTRTDNSANISIFEYERDQAIISVSRSF